MSKEMLLHISEKPWGEISEADYTLEQWHNACLIHLHDGPATSKSQCKLPVRTPNGALNRNGVHAAAAALAGARAPLKAPPEQKAKAAAALRRFYQQLDEEPPESLKQSAIEDILKHVGIKGMKWGVRKERTLSSVGGKRRSSAHPDAVRAQMIGKTLKKGGFKAISNEDLQVYANRLQLEQNVKRLNSSSKNAGLKVSQTILKQAGNKAVQDITSGTMNQVKNLFRKHILA